ncbi:hypothetical protein VA7868_02052 [Vibrio aerogenes CECT 7868]|uniref:DUF4123 domain-containing protein n=1 Tax=Vibrio aerogenes CECT 7868 TaxID=1216006 RepID=A0A1M5YWP6_9VIBR|nr:DUF4123 domain-containing protein [Vibrio aerogenes]SHI16451.1 hypothetical protein VA7868_02052 [Vibrio aerogenes CECT 7868]
MFSLKTQVTEDLNWFVVLSGTSSARPLETFYQHGGEEARGIWLGTDYEGWEEVMPYIAQVQPDHPFIDWIDGETSEAPDWGILVGSQAPFAQVLAHMRSLTQIWLPAGDHAFFRFYDPRFSLKVASLCDDEQRPVLMGPASCWMSHADRVDNPEPVLNQKEKPFPWWEVPAPVMDALTGEDKSTLVINALKWVKETCADLYFYFPEPILFAKVTRLVERFDPQGPVTLNRYLHDALSQEVYR